MKILRSLILTVVIAVTSVAQAQISSQAVLNSLSGPTIQLNWADEKREFELAVDQIGTIDKTGKGQVIYYSPGATVPFALSQVASHQRRTGDQTSLVLYPAGEIRSAESRVFLTSRILVKLDKGARASTVARSINARVIEDEKSGTPGYAVLEVENAGLSVAAAELLRRNPGVLAADPLLAAQPSKYLVPNDPLFSGQWHLQNTGQGGSLIGIDANVVTAWDTRLGTGVGIGIIDDGFQYTHPDLSPNANTTADQDFNSNPYDGDPAPNVALDFHGTAVGGVAGARGNNLLGGSGAAPNATLYGLRLIAAPITDANIRDAFAHRNDIIHIKNNSWGYNLFYYKTPTVLPGDAMLAGTTSGRGGRGTIYVFAAGNGRQAGFYANHRQPNNSRYAVCVGAIANNGIQSYYSESGPNLVVSAPSNGGTLGITTTDIIGNAGYNSTGAAPNLADMDYTNDFGGTSSAAPLVSGVIALLLEQNPNLGWRDVKEILMRTATQIQATDPDWITNGDGFHFNHKYGAGMVNAQQAIALANGWNNLGAEVSNSLSTSGSTPIPDFNSPGGPAGATRTFNLSQVGQGFRVEHVVVEVSATHVWRGDLEFELIAPSGTRSRLIDSTINDDGQDIVTFPLSTVRHWGEQSSGLWTLVARDRISGLAGTLDAVTLRVYGSNTGGGGGGGGGPVNVRYRGLRPTVWVANDLPMPIPDNDPVGATSSLNVGPGSNIAHVEITLRASHRDSSQLTFILTSPEGTTATVSNSAGARNFVTVSQGLTVFTDEDRAGTWRLQAVDNATGLTGVIHGWSLKIW